MLSDLYIKQNIHGILSQHNEFIFIFAVFTRRCTTDRDMLTIDYNSVIRTESIVLLLCYWAHTLLVKNR